jgi:hypothetical protein
MHHGNFLSQGLKFPPAAADRGTNPSIETKGGHLSLSPISSSTVLNGTLSSAQSANDAALHSTNNSSSNNIHSSGVDAASSVSQDVASAPAAELAPLLQALSSGDISAARSVISQLKEALLVEGSASSSGSTSESSVGLQTALDQMDQSLNASRADDALIDLANYLALNAQMSANLVNAAA